MSLRPSREAFPERGKQTKRQGRHLVLCFCLSGECGVSIATFYAFYAGWTDGRNEWFTRTVRQAFADEQMHLAICPLIYGNAV